MTPPTAPSHPTFEAHVDLGHLPLASLSGPAVPRGPMPGTGSAAVALLWIQTGMWSCAVLLFGSGAFILTASAAAETGTPLLEAFTGDLAFTARLIASNLAMLLVLVMSAVFAVRISRGRVGARRGAMVLEATILPAAAVWLVYLLLASGFSGVRLMMFVPGELLVVGVCVATLILLNRPEVRAWCDR